MLKITRFILIVLKAILCLTPWPLRRSFLTILFGYRFDDGARIAILSWIYPNALSMGKNSKIGPLNIAIHLDRIVIGENSSISRGNWITGFPINSKSHFSHRQDRDSSLILGRHSAITKSHHIDCTDRIEIGDFSTVAGYRSQLLTHSIDIYSNRQDCKPIWIGSYCFVGTNAVILGGSRLPDYSVLGAASVLNRAFSKTHFLYAGVPAVETKQIDDEAKYFHRTQGYVD